MQVETRILGGLRCRLVGGSNSATRCPGTGGARPPGAEGTNPAGSGGAAEPLISPRIGVVLCHGYGAPGDDLVSLAAETFRADRTLEDRLCFVFPEAPLALSSMGPWDSRAWWPLDERILDAALTRGAPIETVREAPAELPVLRETLGRLLDELEREEGIPAARVVLGGFSQGAMLATDVALRLPDSPAGLVVFSGTLLDAPEWGRLATARRGMPALVSHGRQDPLLSFRTAEDLRDLLAGAGVRVEFVPFNGPHTISPEGFVSFVGLLQSLVAG
jgi:phospholipase/carboxylesterase